MNQHINVHNFRITFLKKRQVVKPDGVRSSRRSLDIRSNTDGSGRHRRVWETRRCAKFPSESGHQVKHRRVGKTPSCLGETRRRAKLPSESGHQFKHRRVGKTPSGLGDPTACEAPVGVWTSGQTPTGLEDTVGFVGRPDGVRSSRRSLDISSNPDGSGRRRRVWETRRRAKLPSESGHQVKPRRVGKTPSGLGLP
jgi:hypothetical protein